VNAAPSATIIVLGLWAVIGGACSVPMVAHLEERSPKFLTDQQFAVLWIAVFLLFPLFAAGYLGYFLMQLWVGLKQWAAVLTQPEKTAEQVMAEDEVEKLLRTLDS